MGIHQSTKPLSRKPTLLSPSSSWVLKIGHGIVVSSASGSQILVYHTCTFRNQICAHVWESTSLRHALCSAALSTPIHVGKDHWLRHMRNNFPPHWQLCWCMNKRLSHISDISTYTMQSKPIFVTTEVCKLFPNLLIDEQPLHYLNLVLVTCCMFKRQHEISSPCQQPFDTFSVVMHGPVGGNSPSVRTLRIDVVESHDAREKVQEYTCLFTKIWKRSVFIAKICIL